MKTRQILTPDVNHVHVVGIAGAGMSGIAAGLLDLNLRLSGSDLRATRATDRLEARGAEFHRGHSPANVSTADLVVHSAAVPADNEELQAAREQGIPITTRAAIIAELFNESCGVAIAGTHGKSTTSAMTATILRETGRNPSFLIGAPSPSLNGTNGRLHRGGWMVVEADEFDSAFLQYEPDIAVLTHLEPDHLDYFGSESQLMEAFATFVAKMPPDACLVVRGDIERLRLVTSESLGDPVWFGPGEIWDIRSYSPGSDGSAVEFQTPHGILACHLSLRGRHNAWNALAALIASTLAGVNADEAAEALESFAGAERRLQVRACAGGVCVVEDYAHHPTAVRAAIEAAREFTHTRLWAIYQPLLRSRTLDLIDDFASAFSGADRVTFAEIYSPPGRENGITVSASLLAERVRHPDATFEPSLDAIANSVSHHATDGDVILVMGPESITPLADRISKWANTRTAA